MNTKKDLLEEFIEWAKDCGKDVFYIFDHPDEAIDKFLKQRK
jgi:hypothetical protein